MLVIRPTKWLPGMVVVTRGRLAEDGMLSRRTPGLVVGETKLCPGGSIKTSRMYTVTRLEHGRSDAESPGGCVEETVECSWTLV